MTDGSNRLILISGCSGGGKSTLLAELARRGHATVAEPGRRIVAEELASDGRALPWISLEAFARRALAMALADLAEARRQAGYVFFDRGLIDAAVALRHATGAPLRETLGPRAAYATPVFLAPPWPEIFAQDAARRHDFTAAVDEYERLEDALKDLGHDALILPKTSVTERADFVVAHLPDP